MKKQREGGTHTGCRGHDEEDEDNEVQEEHSEQDQQHFSSSRSTRARKRNSSATWRHNPPTHTPVGPN